MLKTFLFSIFISISSTTYTDDIDYSTAKITYLDFWTSWCPPCLASFPWMDKMQQKYANKGLQIIAVNLDEHKKLAEKFLQKTPVSFQIVYNNNFSLAEKFKVQVMPSSFILNNKGEIIYSHLGFNDKGKKDLEHKFIQLLQ